MATVGRQALLAAGVAVAAMAVAGCGASTSGGDYGGPHPDYSKALAGSPPPLAALHRQANRLLPGGRDAYERRIDSLHGYPVVANIWASWCGPCRFEFPSLQKLSAAFGKRVAFIGVDTEDSDDAARTFLSESPVPYPSYTDPNADIKNNLGGVGLPDTAFYDRSGELCFLKQGQYASHADMLADVRRYALMNRCESG
jgi:thiol-disulfide isomerase/thioredoxin